MASGRSEEKVARVNRIFLGEKAGRRENKSDVKTQGSTLSLHLKLFFLIAGEAIGTPCVAVKCVDIRRNTSGEGGLLDSN